jgi:RecJ-like exonuclease
MISTSNILIMDRPLIVTAKSKDGSVKISARATEKLVKEGIKLGEVFAALSKEYSGLGGGHDIAAGAQITPEKLEEYLRELNRRLMKRRI